MGTRWISPQQAFNFLTKTGLVEIVDFGVPDPASALDRWAAVADAEVYGPLNTLPEVEVSRTMHGPGTREYPVRFPSPSAYVDDMACARVCEPADSSEGESFPTLVFCTGLAMACDTIEYWTE